MKKIVPHCLKCKNLDIVKIGKHNYYWCNNEETIAIWGRGSRRIYAKHIKISPMWCPLRTK